VSIKVGEIVLRQRALDAVFCSGTLTVHSWPDRPSEISAYSANSSRDSDTHAKRSSLDFLASPRPLVLLGGKFRFVIDVNQRSA
jgi:hypothetical protein